MSESHTLKVLRRLDTLEKSMERIEAMLAPIIVRFAQLQAAAERTNEDVRDQ